MTDAQSQFDTRRAAHTRIEPTKAETCDRIMVFAAGRGAYGLTADEVAENWQCVHNHVAPRISELKLSGLLVETKRTRRTRAGSHARVLVATQFAEDESRLVKAHEWIVAARPKAAEQSLFGDISPDRSYKE